jgi:anti-sigma factor RsiW
MLIEKFEPQIQAGLRSSLKTMKAQHPEQAALFLTNWNKLNAAVNSELAAPPMGAPPMGGRRRVKRTRRNKRSSK